MHPSYDLVGCGFGPANLALAVAIVEHWSKSGRASSQLQRVCFIEKHSTFQWHPGMLLPDTIMQISCLKDLATLRNPTSPFTFLSYLHEHNRLVSFINRGSVIPTRREYADYLSWASEKVRDAGIEIFYGEEITSLESLDDSHIHCISHKDGQVIDRFTPNVVIAPGGVPRIPSAFASLIPSPNILHTSAYAHTIETAFTSMSSNFRPLKVCIVGSGQSAAETFLDVRSRLCDIACSASGEEPVGRHEIDLLIRRDSLKPSDDSPFSNEIFDPISTDKIYNLPTGRSRKRLLEEYQSTNYGVVNPRTLELIYECMYNQKIEEGTSCRLQKEDARPRAYPPRLNILNNQSIIHATQDTPLHPGLRIHGIKLAIQHTLTRELLESRPYDIVILATGYERNIHLRLLEGNGIAEKFGLQPDSHEGKKPEMLSSLDIEATSTLFTQPVGLPALSEPSPTPPSSPSPATSLGTSLGTSSATSSDESRLQLSPGLIISRNYRLIPRDPNMVARVYLQGCSETTHGISETLLSVVSVRAGEILEDILS